MLRVSNLAGFSQKRPTKEVGGGSSLIANTSKRSTDGNGITTDAINTTGATLLVIGLSYHDGTSPTISDSKSNTWTALTARGGVSANATRLYYCLGGTVGTGHTFTVAGTGIYPAIAVQAFSVMTAFDQESGASNGAASTLQPGSLTPAVNNSILVTAVASNQATSPTIDSGFTSTDAIPFTSAQNYSVGLAYKIQTTAAAENPTWNITSSGTITTGMAVFN